MKIAGIIAEYNPFHNGHKYHIEQTRNNGATHIVAVMGGSFLQRGSAACMPKQIRAAAAIACGADIVIELPLPYAMSTAERFAYGGVYLLNSLGCVDAISFGSESKSLDKLKKAAEAVEDKQILADTKKLLKSGITYAAAREQAVKNAAGDDIAGILRSPNNTLAVEYIKQLMRQNSTIMPENIARYAAAHDSIKTSAEFASASYIRNNAAHNINELAKYVPPEAMTIYSRAIADGKAFYSDKKTETAVLAVLRTMTLDDIKSLPDISEGIENRIYSAVRTSSSLDEICEKIKTKRYTLARIRRIIMSAYVGLNGSYGKMPPPYIRVLGFNSKGAEVLNKAKKTASLNIFTSAAKIAKQGGSCESFIKLEAKATDLYSLGLPKPDVCGSDFTMSVRQSI